jgi:hypothetical protein
MSPENGVDMEFRGEHPRGKRRLGCSKEFKVHYVRHQSKFFLNKSM